MSDPPSTPRQPPGKSAPKAWADMVDDMETMPVEQARRLRPSDMGVKIGPIMDERQFQEYCKTRGNRVQVITKPQK